MRQTTPFAPFLLAAVLAACSDAPTMPLPPDDAAHAKGGVKGKPGDDGGSEPSASMAALGEALFMDENLSVHQNQSCSTCHEPSEGFAGPLSTATTQGSVVEGSVAGEFGDRKPPTAAYATLAPTFDGSGKGAVGGNFWDGRATGELLGNPAADQALGPFLNPVEQAMPDEACVIWRVAGSSYLTSWVDAWGAAITTIAFPTSNDPSQDTESICTTPVQEAGEYVPLSSADRQAVDEAYDQVALSIQAFEASLNVFSSPFDAGQLLPPELDGEKLFSSKGKCHQCHEVKADQPLFTDFEFHNLGVPRNPDHPVHYFGSGTFDEGLGGFTGNAADLGKFKTPTVRNVAVGSNRTFMHNGSLKSLRQVVQFYNTRDVLPECGDGQLDDPTEWGPDGEYGCWPAPEYPANLDTKNMGNLGLTSGEVDAIVAFMQALSDQ